MKNKNVNEPLPFSRKQQFKFLVLDNPSLLFFVNLTAALFLIPLGFSLSLILVSYSNVANSDNINSINCFYSIFYPSLTLIPAMLIAGLGMSGMYGVLQDLTLNDISKYKKFWSSIKQNFKQFLIFYGFIGLILFLIAINFAIYFYLPLNAFFKLFALIFSFVLLAIVIFIKPYVLLQMTLFNNSLPQIIRNSIGFISKRFFLNLLCVISSVAMPILILFAPGFFRTIPIFLLASFYLVFSNLYSYLFCIDTLETFVSRDQTKDFYHKGLEEN